ncbi:MAG TPA: phage tail protein [Egibacteraceae bacterium]|nr:phage tail protein [Egibacteraceae bacterium]
MRGTVEGLESPHPVGLALPALYQENEFVQQFVAGFDGVLAPLFTTLDCLDAYFDAQVAPPDFLLWLAQWVGVALDENWPEERQRDLVARMVALYGSRGTVAGLREVVRIITGAEPEVDDSGGAAWSPVPGGEPPGRAEPRLRVRVPEGSVSRKRLEALVAGAVPAHVVVDVEVGG